MKISCQTEILLAPAKRSLAIQNNSVSSFQQLSYRFILKPSLKEKLGETEGQELTSDFHIPGQELGQSPSEGLIVTSVEKGQLNLFRFLRSAFNPLLARVIILSE